ncbi:conserved Plasmodium protein, unknown function [Plasmodium malariae]|uniref:Uncharacterized protein n=1 Tax=Plasmodium malariae TaxID=5858 RepID=A0A1D3JM90_PLAMA|nr:conserved Plasmodium protein, unknown function [Plasmodium malariae]SBT87790.1 conserved Plasmodium protein, unknown function [Plasmodium malariae]
MDENIVLREIEKRGYNHVQFFKHYFGASINEREGNIGGDEVGVVGEMGAVPEVDGLTDVTEEGKEFTGLKYDEGEILERVQILKKQIEVEKNYLNNKINEEAENYKEKVYHMKSHLDEINFELFNIDIINRMNQKKASNKRGSNDGKEKKQTHLLQWGSGKMGNFTENQGADVRRNIRDNLEGNLSSRLSGNLGCISCGSSDRSDEVGNYEEEEEEEEGDCFLMGENKSNLKFENLLKKSIETKTFLEEVKKGLLFLKALPALKKDMSVLFVTGKSIKQEVEDKIKNVLTLYSNLKYINEHDEIVSYFREHASVDISVYTKNFFDNFFTLLNDILSSYIIDNTSIDMMNILKIYIDVYKTFLKFTNVHNTYTNEYLINHIGKKIIEFLISNFTKTFFKFAQTDSDHFMYNSIINYYEYFTAFIEEKKEPMEKIVHQIVLIVGDENEMRRNHHHNDRTYSSECMHSSTNKNEENKDKAEVPIVATDLTMIFGKEEYNDNMPDRHVNVNEKDEKPIYEEKEGEISSRKNKEEHKNASYVENYHVHLFKESINVVCIFMQNWNFLKSPEMSNENDKTLTNNIRKSFLYKIMDSLNSSITILSNCSLFISKKNIFQKILKESTFINKEIVNEYLINITDVSHFDMVCFDNIILKVSIFDRNNLIEKSKLFHFFTDLKKDIINIIHKKRLEINNKNIFNSHFFRFVIFFSFIYHHDTQFLLIFINIYNFLYEIIYNIKEEIKRKKEESEIKKIHQAYIDESLQLKQEFTTSNEVIDYIKTIISTFISVLNLFNDIIEEYEKFGAFIFERTYYHLKSNTTANILSKIYLQREKGYPSSIDGNLAHIHTYFYSDDLHRRVGRVRSISNISRGGKRAASGANGENDGTDVHNAQCAHVPSDERNLTNGMSASLENMKGEQNCARNFLTLQGEIHKGEYVNSADNVDDAKNKSSDELAFSSRTDAHASVGSKRDASGVLVHSEDIQFDECGKHVLKSSLSKLNEIKNTILKNVIYFSLIPLNEYLNKYVSKITCIKMNQQIDNFDPHENICLIIETVFSYIEIFYGNKGGEHMLQQLFLHLSEKFTFHINNINSTTNLNRNIILQIQADVNYFINVCKRFNIKNYKQFFLLYHSISFSLNFKKENSESLDIQSSFQSYINDHIKKEGQLNFNITADDIVKTALYISNSLII